MTFVQKIKSGDVCTGSACCGLIFCPEFSLQNERPYHSIFFHARIAVCAASFDPSTESGFTSECDLCECYNINTCHRDDNKVHSETEYMSIAAEINYAINTGYVLLSLLVHSHLTHTVLHMLLELFASVFEAHVLTTVSCLHPLHTTEHLNVPTGSCRNSQPSVTSRMRELLAF